MNQREAVFNAVTSVFKDNEVQFEEGMNAGELLTKEMRSDVIGIIVSGISDGTVEFSESAHAKYNDEAKKRAYTSGLVSNWLRKDKKLNGGISYQPKNPGSRVGSTDAKLKALRQLKKQFDGVDAEKAAEIQTHIDARVTEISAEKAKKVEIDLSVLDPDLIESLGLNE